MSDSRVEGYWLIRDDSLMEVFRVKGWNGETPNPLCFNCEHTLARHFPDPKQINRGMWETVRKYGMSGHVCQTLGCGCTDYHPSHVEGDEYVLSG